jgi:hypothetical protein
MWVSNTRTDSAKGRSIGLILTELVGEDGEVVTKSGWDLWIAAERMARVGWGLPEALAYSSFKTALSEMTADGLLKVVGFVKGRSKTSAAAKVYRLTSMGSTWSAGEGAKYIGGGLGGGGSAGGVVDEDVRGLALLVRLARTPQGIAAVGSRSTPGRRAALDWLREMGYVRDLVQVTALGRTIAEVEDNGDGLG